MRLGRANPASSLYLNKEVFLNNLKLVSINTGTEYALGVVVVDVNGNPVSTPSSTASITSVASSAADGVIIAANSLRKGLVIFNDSTAILFIALTEASSSSNFSYRLTPNATLELIGDKNFTGLVNGIWASANGFARVTELLA